ncbi:MAG: RNA polymerase sigma factor [Ginsengibacter sp.]
MRPKPGKRPFLTHRNYTNQKDYSSDIFFVCNNCCHLATYHRKLTTLQKQEAETAFVKHVSEHELMLYKICRIYAHSDADRQDLFQEMVIQLWKAYPKFKGDSKISTWLYRVALNTAISELRKKKNVIRSYEPSTIPESAGAHYPEYSEEERLQQLYQAIEQLNEVEKAIVMLYMEERTYEEMEEILGVGQGNLRVKMNRIKEKLRQLTKNY